MSQHNSRVLHMALHFQLMEIDQSYLSVVN